MEFSNFRPESHVAQQSRRDKLRVQQSSTAQSQHLEDYPNNQGLNPDVFQVPNLRYGNISYNPAMFSSEMLNFSANSSQVLLARKDAMEVVHQESSERRIAADESASIANSTHPISSVFHPPPKVSGDPQNCGTWKSIDGSQQSCDWIGNYSSGLTGSESNHNNPLFVNNISSPSLYLKPSFNGYQDVQSSLTNPSSEISSQNRQKHYEEMQFNSLPLYQNTPLAAGVSSNTAGLVQCRDSGRGSWAESGNELVLLPNCGDQSIPLRLNDASSAWISRLEDGCHHQWSTGELGFLANKSNRDLRTIASNSNTHGLSLSLSHGGQFGEDLHSGTSVFDGLRSSKTLKSDYFCSNSKLSIDSGKNTCQDMIGSSNFTHGNTGPLGPFTGYATILKGSKFLKPAQKLLDEICVGSDPKNTIKTSEVSDRVSNDVGYAAESMVGLGAKGSDDPGVSASTFYSANEISGEAGVLSSSSESYRPEFQQKKAKLLFMQEEVCRRYKQYHQQMQMVVSSFESVAGLSAATPYISLALKTVSRHFRCLKNSISDQLRYIRKALGEDLSSPTTGASSRKDDKSTSSLTVIDHSFSKQKSGGGNLSFFEPQQHVWRPQRGLPERSVAVLRAWLFEHFLHPYPTDTDKQMLANQTGLSRNQVSNWFINARVRVWKPMVEEIHMLETKGLAESNSNVAKNDGRPTTEGASCSNGDQTLNRLGVTSTPGEQVECLRIGSLAGTGVGQNAAEQWNQDKRSRVECQIPATSMDASLMGGFMPYQRSGLEIGGLGAVSLTLGLRQSAESAQQQQLQQHEHQLMQHFGGQMIHDFVG